MRIGQYLVRKPNNLDQGRGHNAFRSRSGGIPRYHFGSANGHREPDPQGVVLDDNKAAQAYAIKYAGEVPQSGPAALWENGQWRVEVTDDAGALLFTVVTLAIDAPKQVNVFDRS